MHDDFSPSLKEWIFILSVSSRYDMDTIRQRAIREIVSHRPNINPVEKIVLAEKHNIPEWLAPAYASLCQRANPLEEWEAKRLGMRVTVKLARAREAVRDLRHDWDIPVEPEQPSSDLADHKLYNRHVNRIIAKVFWPSSNMLPDVSMGQKYEFIIVDICDS